MGLIDLILNVACVLLWFNWRSARLGELQKSSPVSLAATLKKAEPHRSRGWLSLVILVAVLTARSFFYWKAGTAWNWTPRVELGVVSLPFRSDFLARSILFSVLSFGLLLAWIYAWLLLLSTLNRAVGSDVPLQKLVRLHLGQIDRWPNWIKLLLPGLVVAACWSAANPGLVQLGIVPSPLSSTHVWQQAILLGLSSFLVWKTLLLMICVLYLLNSYIYLGNSPFWNFVHATGTNLLWPFRGLPLCIGKLDLAPLLVIFLVVLVAHWSARWLPKLFERLPL